MSTFEIKGSSFILDGSPIRILAGAVHYFRVPRACWRDRLQKLKDCGFNTVETYAAANAHMPEEGKFITDDNLDLDAFLKTAQDLGLYAIVRPGPYICSEWDFGGLPWWLLNKNCALRCSDPEYLKFVYAYFDRILPIIAYHRITNGGNVIMVQIENEYGSYGDDKTYLKCLRDKMLAKGIDILLFTSDGDAEWMLTGGTCPGELATVNFGSDAALRFERLRSVNKTGPLMCAEYWNGWFDHWGEHHHARRPEDSAACYEEALKAGASVSVYMFHGGTNFGYMNGANCPTRYEYQPTVSSYDDDALLNECGDITPKYRLFKQINARYGAEVSETESAPCPKANYGHIPLKRVCGLFDLTDRLDKRFSAVPLNMEALGQGYGFILYHAFVSGPRGEKPLELEGLGDLARVFVNREYIGTISRNDSASPLRVSVPKEGLELDILVENMGRVNYGPFLRDKKGLTGARLGQQYIYGWSITCLPLSDVSALPAGEGCELPAFFTGTFDAGRNPADTFVKLPGFEKGIVFINGKPLSRYWEIGPQRSAYLPGCFLKPGANEITVFETGEKAGDCALLDDFDDLGEIRYEA